MEDDDVMVRVTVILRRNGHMSVHDETPTEPVAVGTLLKMALLDAAKIYIHNNAVKPAK